MAAATLSLFPNPSLKNKSGQKSNLRYGQRSTREPDFEMIKMSDTAQGIVIAIQESPAPSPTIKTPEKDKSPRLSSQQQNSPAIVLSAPSNGQDKPSPVTITRPRTPSPPATQVQSNAKSGSPVYRSPRSQPPSPLRQEGSPRSHPSPPTLVRKASNASTRTATHSPVMRSMFPRYDPSIPLNQQRYYPNSKIGTDATGQLYSPIVSSEQNRQSSRPSAPALIIPISSGAVPILQQSSSGPAVSTFSASEQLLHLWDIANGQSQDGMDEDFKVELGCDSLSHLAETISFSSPLQKLYALSASSTAVNISRTHPRHPTPTIPICETTLSIPTATSPLLATIFPKLAELMAVDQSSSIAVNHHLDRQASSELQTEAISRAQQNEASNLVWDSDSGKYFLIHPTLLDNASTTFPIEITPTALSPEKITIAAPETNGATPLLALDLPSKTLTIHSGPITALPSLYTLDTLITALLTLLLHLHRSSAFPAAKVARDTTITPPSFPPPPTLLTLASRPTRSRKRTLSTWSKSVFSSSQRNNPKIQNQDIDLEAGPRTGYSTIADAEMVMQTKHERAETEREGQHDWSFQPLVNADDENLPGATRAMLRTLYWCFQVFVWVLGVGVNLIAAGIVGMGKLVKKA